MRITLCPHFVRPFVVNFILSLSIFVFQNTIWKLSKNIAMKYYFPEQSRVIKAENATEFVERMRMHDEEYFADNKEFMEIYSIRKWQFHNILLHISCEKKFVESLLANGILRKIQFDLIVRILK